MAAAASMGMTEFSLQFDAMMLECKSHAGIHGGRNETTDVAIESVRNGAVVK
jgi:hypothetical protein